MEITKTRDINVKDATLIAIKTAKDLFEGQQLLDLALEEVEMTDDEQYWLITLGFFTENTTVKKTSPFAAFSPAMRYSRKYKLFKIDAHTGEVHSMKIRVVS